MSPFYASNLCLLVRAPFRPVLPKKTEVIEVYACDFSGLFFSLVFSSKRVMWRNGNMLLAAGEGLFILAEQIPTEPKMCDSSMCGFVFDFG